MPASKPNAPSKAFEAEVSARLRQRGRELLAGQAEVLAILKDARAQILETLAGLPADWQNWHLSQLLGQVDDVLTGATGQAGTLFTGRMASAWEAGELLIERPLELVVPGVRGRFAQLDVGVLKQMQSFGALRLKDVGSEAARKISRQLGLVTIGAQTPFESIKAVQKVLGAETPARAATIVQAEVSRAFAVAGQQRLAQAIEAVPGLGKQWRRSGKIHSRWNHDIMDGQVVAADKPFRVPNPNGGADLMQGPHDPKAPVEQVIHCGCVAIPWMKEWEVQIPGAKPFTAKELQRDPGKAELDRRAKAAGYRPEPAKKPAAEPERGA